MSRRKTHAQEPAAEQPETGSALEPAESGPAVDGGAGRDGMAGTDKVGDAEGRQPAGIDGGGGLCLDPAGAPLAHAGTGAAGQDVVADAGGEAAAVADVAGAADPAKPVVTIDPVADGIDADPEPNLHPSLVRVMCAVQAAGWASRPFIDDPDMHHDFMSRLFTPKAIDALKTLIRQIGDRATPAVLGQQLFLKGHRDSGTLTPMETAVLDIFGHVLRRLDAHRALIDETAREAAAEMNRPAPLKVPIEDTMLEPIDGAFDTW